MRGHIYKRSKSSWTYVIDSGMDPETGRRRQTSRAVRGSKLAAEVAMAKHITELEREGLTNPTDMTFGEYLREWMTTKVKLNVRRRTAQGYLTIVKNHLYPKLGLIKLSELSPRHLQQYYARQLEIGRLKGGGGLSPQTVKHHHRVISIALGEARRLGYISTNVARAVSPPKVPRYQPRVLESEELQLLLEACAESKWHLPIRLVACTGLRRSELLGLRWRDVDFERSRIHTVQVLNTVAGEGLVLEEPRTAMSSRVLTLDDRTMHLLRIRLEQQEHDKSFLKIAPSRDDLIFSYPQGIPWKPDDFTKAVPRFSQRAGLGKVRLHDLRHSHASIMLMADVHLKVVQERLGHSTIATTADIYSHVVSSLQRDAVNRFDDELEKGNGASNS